MKPVQSYKLSIIIPVYKGKSYFKACLQSVIQEKIEEVEIVVVVDGNGDGAWKEAQRPDVRIVKLKTNSGPAVARNQGALHAQGEWLFFVDADVTVCPGAVSQILSFFERHPEVDALMGSYDDAPGEMNFFSQYKNLFHHYIHQTGREEASTFWGACGAIRRQKFLDLGGFNEVYRNPMIEDIELGTRLKRHGGKIRLLKTLQVKHLKKWTCRSMLYADILFRAIPWTILLWRERALVNDLNLRTDSRISVVLVFLLVVSLLASFIIPVSLAISLFASLLLVWINRDLYLFFQKKRGNGFMLKCLPWHWLYFLYCGGAFGCGTLAYLWGRKSKAGLQLHRPLPRIKSSLPGKMN
jgi:glycosyltransferase involved in cell wall biosynthesis